MKNLAFLIKNKSCKKLQPDSFLFELSMEEYIVKHPEILTLSEDYSSPIIEGCEVAKKNRRYDIVARFEKLNTLAIIETKKGKLDNGALVQLFRYINANATSSTPLEADDTIGILIGTDIDASTISSIESSSNLYAIVLEKFNSDVDEIIHTTIYSPKETKSKRDYTKYTLIKKNGTSCTDLGKSRLVFEIVREYLEQKPCTLKELQKVFPKNLAKRGVNSRMPIVREAGLNLDNNLYDRYFKEELNCSDVNILVCNQWGIGNIQNMINKANELGMTIIIQH